MNFTKTILKNGLRLILAPQRDAKAITVLTLIEAGSEYETKSINGLSHLLEHMAFKGTKKRPQANLISEELDSIGAEYNAFTGQEYTGYWVKAEIAHLNKVLDILSDMYINPIFDAEELRKEKGVVLEEIRMYEDIPQRKIADVALELLYGDQPAGWSVAGTEQIVPQISRDQIVEYYTNHYTTPNTVISIAGGFDEKNVIEKIESYFKDSPAGTKVSKSKTLENQSAPAIKLQTKKTDQGHIIIANRGFTLFDEKRFAADMLGDILGGGMSSRLFKTIRDKHGAAYYVKAGHDSGKDHGFFAVSSGLDLRRLGPMLKEIVREMKELKETRIDAKELEKSKEHIKGSLVLNLETSDDLANFYGIQEILTGKILSIDDIFGKIKGLTSVDIQNIATEIFQPEKINLAGILPEGIITEQEALSIISKI